VFSFYSTTPSRRPVPLKNVALTQPVTPVNQGVRSGIEPSAPQNIQAISQQIQRLILAEQRAIEKPTKDAITQQIETLAQVFGASKQQMIAHFRKLVSG
jgi:hypothetical protein